MLALLDKFVAVGIGGDSGGDVEPSEVRYSIEDAGGFPAADATADWWAECWAADIFANNDWNDALGEYNAPTPGGSIGDGGALKQTDNKRNI